MNATKRPLIKGIGKINVDLVFDGLKRLPSPGEELYASSFEPLLGGGVPSMLFRAAAFGAETELVTYIGKGFFSKFSETALNGKGIKYFNLLPESYPGSGINVTAVMLTPGERSFVTCSDDFTASDDDVYRLLRGADVVLAEDGKYLDVYKKLRSEGAVVIGDFGYSEEMSLEKPNPSLDAIDYYLPNSLEAEKLTSSHDPEEMVKRLSAFVPCPVVTLGKEGAIYFKNGVTVTIPIDSVTEISDIVDIPVPDLSREIVDATGAGDAFTGGFAYAIGAGYDIRRAVIFGHAAAQTVVMKKGCY